MKQSYKVSVAAMMTIVICGLTACQKEAHAATTSYDKHVNASVLYSHDKAMNIENGVQTEISISPNAKDNIRFGLTGTFDADKSMDLRKYGLYTETRIPLTTQGQLSLTPRFGISQYKDESVEVADIGIGAEYKITPSVVASARYTYVSGLNRDSELQLQDNNNVYGAGLTFKF